MGITIRRSILAQGQDTTQNIGLYAFTGPRAGTRPVEIPGIDPDDSPPISSRQ